MRPRGKQHCGWEMDAMFEHVVNVRWRDVDALGHVNHAVFLT